MTLLQRILTPLGVEYFGVCRFRDCLPLLPCRAAARIPEGTQSVIVLLLPYHIGEVGPRNVARYAVLPDYHRVAGELLATATAALEAAHPEEHFAPFVDSSPIREVAAARLAGLGAVGLHGQLIHPVYGSRVFLATIVTTLTLPPDKPSVEGCMGCGRCIAACPTGAIGAGKALDKDLCRSHITQKKGTLTLWEEEQVAAGGLVWGCDLCADACPLGKKPPSTPIRAFYRDPAPLVTAENLDALLPEKSYGYRGKAVLLRNYNIIQNRS